MKKVKVFHGLEEFKMVEIDSHRNGISGAPFHIIKFDYREYGEIHNMIGLVFQEPGCVAVFDRNLLYEGEIRFFHNSWRGDHFEDALREAIKNYDLHDSDPEYYKREKPNVK